MTERAYITVDRAESPRLIQIADIGAGGSNELTIQDLHDTLNSNTLSAGDPDDSLDNMDDDFLIDSAGKAALGGSLATGITATLQNAQIAFDGNYTPVEVGTATAGDPGGEQLTDMSANFQFNGVLRGAIVLNWDDRSATEVLRVVSDTVIEHRPLQGGIANTWTIGDAYSVYNVIQKVVAEGNLVAIDNIGDPLAAIFPTFATQVIVALDTSAAAIATAGLTPSQQEIRDAQKLAPTAGAPAVGSVDELLLENPANVVAEINATLYDGVSYADILQDLLSMANGRIEENPAGTYTFFEQDNTTPRFVLIKSGAVRSRV